MNLPGPTVNRALWTGGLAAIVAGTVFLTGSWRLVHLPAVEQKSPGVVEVAAEAPGTPERSGAAPDWSARRHRIVQGETLSGIARSYNVDVETLLGGNPGLEETIYPDTELVILPQKGTVHIVESGDTLWRISRGYGVDMETVMTANGKENNHIAPGEKLFIPGGKPFRAEVAVSRGRNGPFIWPAQGEISSYYGWRWGRNHDGVDIANDLGAPVFAAKSGQVIWTGWQSGYGHTVMIDHGQGYVTLYGHLDQYETAPGQYVRAGQRIADMGSSGYSTGPHLHFEVRRNGTAVDPLGVLP